MDIGILVPVEIRQAINHRVWFLRGGGVVEPDQLPAMNSLLQDREILADQSRIKRTLGNSKLRRFKIRTELDGLDSCGQ